MKINCISTDVWAVDRSDRGLLSNIPNHDIVIPTARDDVIRIFLVELDAEDFQGVTIVSALGLELCDKLSGLLIIDSDNCI